MISSFRLISRFQLDFNFLIDFKIFTWFQVSNWFQNFWSTSRFSRDFKFQIDFKMSTWFQIDFKIWLVFKIISKISVILTIQLTLIQMVPFSIFLRKCTANVIKCRHSITHKMIDPQCTQPSHNDSVLPFYFIFISSLRVTSLCNPKPNTIITIIIKKKLEQVIKKSYKNNNQFSICLLST